MAMPPPDCPTGDAAQELFRGPICRRTIQVVMRSEPTAAGDAEKSADGMAD